MTTSIRDDPNLTDAGPDLPQAIGWVGLGDQGAPMARAIAETGFDLHTRVRRAASLVLRLAYQLDLEFKALINLLLAGTASSFALQALGGAVDPENAGHLSVLQVIDIELFDEAVAALGVSTPDISARAMQGAKGLPEAARLVAGWQTVGAS